MPNARRGAEALGRTVRTVAWIHQRRNSSNSVSAGKPPSMASWKGSLCAWLR